MLEVNMNTRFYVRELTAVLTLSPTDPGIPGSR